MKKNPQPSASTPKNPSKSKKESSSAIKENLETKEIFQALILADSFDKRFEPITLDSPRSLLPLINVALIEYTIEFLTASGVEEIYIFCCSHALEIKDYIKSSKWIYQPGLRVKTIISTDSISAGDALREVARLGYIRYDFVLVSGDVIANLRLKEILDEHKKRRQNDKSALVTMILKKAEPYHRTRSLQDDVVVCIDRQTNQLLHFENDVNSNEVQLDVSIFTQHQEVQFRNDVLDCRIDICAPETLFSFADNFDYQDIRQDFIRGVLIDDISGHKIFTHVITGEYAARVKDLRTYDSVSKDILHRWTYPIVPDLNIIGDTSFTVTRYLCYVEKNVKFERSCKIGTDVAFGAGTIVGEDSHITNSVIGRNCKIGANVSIKNSYLWDGVMVEDNVIIDRAILCNNVTILKNSRVQEGSILSFDVCVGPDFTVVPNSKLTTNNEAKDEDGNPLTQEIFLGKNGFGRTFVKESDPYNTFVPISFEKNKLATKKVEPKKVLSPEEEFMNTARDILFNTKNMDNAIMELNMAHKSLNNEHSVVLKSILIILFDSLKDVKESDLTNQIKKVLEKYSRVLTKFREPEDDLDIILDIQDYCSQKEHEKFKKAFPVILHTLYQLDIMEEDTIFKWEQECSEEDKEFVKLSKQFLDWLKEENEEDEEEETEESKPTKKQNQNNQTKQEDSEEEEEKEEKEEEEEEEEKEEED